ncbi:MAG: hypothetical protein AVDCRST_MAG66-3880, partial [uncultured Pseudonocardia sp.]
MGGVDVSVGSEAVLLVCGDQERLPLHGRRRAPAVPGVPVVALPARPERAEVDAVLVGGPRRVIVQGTDADLAAVVLRLLRTERLGIEVAHLPAGRSAVATLFGLPPGRAAVDL